jgi:hypothetical protein
MAYSDVEKRRRVRRLFDPPAIEVLERRHANRTTSPWVFPAASASGHGDRQYYQHDNQKLAVAVGARNTQ